MFWVLVLFLRSKPFRKNNKKSRLEIALITLYYTTDVHRQPLTLVTFPLVQVPFYVLRRLCKLNKTPSDGTCLGEPPRGFCDVGCCCCLPQWRFSFLHCFSMSSLEVYNRYFQHTLNIYNLKINKKAYLKTLEIFTDTSNYL